MISDDCKKITDIIQGERKELNVTLVNANNGEAIDLSSAVNIQSIHPTQDGQNLIKKLEKAGVAEVSTIETVADSSSSLESTCFELNSPNLGFIFYYTVDGNGVAPSLSGKQIVAIDIAENDDADTVAAKTQSIINAQSSFNATVLNNLITVINADEGECEDAADKNTGFTFATTAQGVTEILDSIEYISGGSFKIKIKKEETTLLKEENNATIFIAVDYDLQDRKIYKITSAYNVCGTNFILE